VNTEIPGQSVTNWRFIKIIFIKPTKAYSNESCPSRKLILTVVMICKYMQIHVLAYSRTLIWLSVLIAIDRNVFSSCVSCSCGLQMWIDYRSHDTKQCWLSTRPVMELRTQSRPKLLLSTYLWRIVWNVNGANIKSWT